MSEPIDYRACPQGKRRGIDVGRMSREIGRLIHANFHPTDIEVDDLVQETCMRLLRNNESESAFDPTRASFSKYVLLVAGGRLSRMREKLSREVLVGDESLEAAADAIALSSPEPDELPEAMAEMRDLNVDAIVVPERRARRMRDVSSLVESLERGKLIEPIVVRRMRDGRLVLIAGSRRLEAHRRLGRAFILGRVVVCTDLEAELMELDENLEREELTVLERGEHLQRRKFIYEQIDPETKRGGLPGKAGGGKQKAKTPDSGGFVKDTAARTGAGASTVREEVQIGALPAPVRDVVAARPWPTRRASY